MIEPRPTGAVIDAMVVSWLFDARANALAERYRALIDRRPVVLAFQSVMELRYGALRADWGDLRRQRLERRIAQLSVVQPDDEMISVCAEPRQECRSIGHPLAGKIHDGDRWIAATAIRLAMRPRVSRPESSARARARPARWDR